MPSRGDVVKGARDGVGVDGDGETRVQLAAYLLGQAHMMIDIIDDCSFLYLSLGHVCPFAGCEEG
jgi:hypothetical protein